MSINLALADLEIPVEETPAAENLPAAESNGQAEVNPPETNPAAETTAGELSPGLGEESAVAVPDEPPTVESLQKQLAELRNELATRCEFDGEISDLSKLVEQSASAVLAGESSVERAKANLKLVREEYDGYVDDLRALIADRDNGQKRLPFDGPGVGGSVKPVMETVAAKINNGELNTGNLTVTASVGSSGDPHAATAITQLGQKPMIALAGQDEWQAAKDRELPFGMTDKEITILEQHDIFTVGHLEQRMRDDAYWHQNIKGFGEGKVSKLIESLRVWRTKFPMVG